MVYPINAQVLIDGRYAHAHTTLPAVDRTYVVTAQQPDYQPLRATVRATRAGGRVELMRAAFGHVSVTTSLPGAGIWIDGTRRSHGTRRLRLGAGPHRLRAMHKCSQEVLREFVVRVGETTEVDVDTAAPRRATAATSSAF